MLSPIILYHNKYKCIYLTNYGSQFTVCFPVCQYAFFRRNPSLEKIHKKGKTTGIPVVFPLSTLTVGFDLQEAQSPAPQGNGGGGEDGGAENRTGTFKVGLGVFLIAQGEQRQRGGDGHSRADDHRLGQTRLQMQQETKT